jgi:hypothetical protein
VKVKEEEDLDAQCVVCCFFVKIISSDQPVFEQQWYETWIPEDAALQSTALALVATAKNPILYSIEAGNDFDEFGMDYQTGMMNGTIFFTFYSYHSPNETYNCFKSEVVQMGAQWELENSEMEGRRVSMLPTIVIIIIIITFFSRTEKAKERDMDGN